MRKLVSALVILFLCSALYASALASVGIYSDDILDLALLPVGVFSNDLTLGLNTSFAIAYDLSNIFGVGIGGGADIGIDLFSADDDSLTAAAYIGQALCMHSSNKEIASLTVGVGLGGEDDFLGIGVAVNFSVAYFFGRNFGIAAGYTYYWLYDDSWETRNSFYVGFGCGWSGHILGQ